VGVQLLPCEVCGMALTHGDATCSRCGGRADQTWNISGDSKAESQSGGAASGVTLATAQDARYEVLDVLGRGGMGVVYKALDRELDEVIALKVLAPQLANSVTAAERFKREIRIARRINHPNVARLYDLVIWQGRLALSQELIQGRGLDQVMAAGRLPIEVSARYLRYICGGLHAAHKLGVVHRDLKPANILIDTEDRPRILDFGLAVSASEVDSVSQGSIIGTPLYMSPEQYCAPERIDQRSDIYSLGVLIYQMLCGVLPFVARDARSILLAHVNKAPRPPSEINSQLTRDVDSVVLRCLAKNPVNRYASARDLWTELESALHVPAQAAMERTSPPPEPRKPSSLERGKALIIDDDVLTRHAVRAALATMGVATIEAADGPSGIDVAHRHKPNFIILDILMPGLDGQETLRILKSTKATAEIPVVMLTGVHDPEHAAFAKETGAALYLNKPIDVDVLRLVVERYAPALAAV